MLDQSTIISLIVPVITAIAIIVRVDQKQKSSDERYETFVEAQNAKQSENQAAMQRMHAENQTHLIRIEADAKKDREKIWYRIDEVVRLQNETNANIRETVTQLDGFVKLEEERHITLDGSVAELSSISRTQSLDNRQIYGTLGELSGKVETVRDLLKEWRK